MPPSLLRSAAAAAAFFLTAEGHESEPWKHGFVTRTMEEMGDSATHGITTLANSFFAEGGKSFFAQGSKSFFAEDGFPAEDDESPWQSRFEDMAEQQPVVADLLQALTEKDDKVLPNLKAALNSVYEELKHGVMESADAGNTTAPLEDAIQRILLATTYRVAEKVFDLPVTAPTKAMKGVLPFLLGFTKQVVALSVGTANILVGGGGGNKFAAPAQSAIVAVLKKLFEEADEKSVSAVEKFGHVGRGLLTKVVLDVAALDAAERKRVQEHQRIWMQDHLERGRQGLLDLAQEHEEAVEAFQREHGEGIAAKLEELDKKFERRAALFALVEEVSADFESQLEAANTLMGGRPRRGQKMPTWVLVLIIVGCVVLVGAIAGGIACCCCCCRNANAVADHGSAAGGGRFSMDSYFSDSDLEI